MTRVIGLCQRHVKSMQHNWHYSIEMVISAKEHPLYMHSSPLIPFVTYYYFYYYYFDYIAYNFVRTSLMCLYRSSEVSSFPVFNA